ncbi:MAG: hypothetical protein HC898_07930 [Phycisphaerales bacterium]|nr:hypothetical protein [Phycisphaerales bacterium]
MILSILRGLFILLVTAVTALYVLTYQSAQFETNQYMDFPVVLAMMLVAVGISLTFVIGDVLTPHKKLSAMSGVFWVSLPVCWPPMPCRSWSICLP